MPSSVRTRWRPVPAISLGLFAGCLVSVGCQPTRAQNAIILHVYWDKIKGIEQVNLHPRDNSLEVTAVLESDEVVNAKLPITSQQSWQLRDGAVLMVLSKDRYYYDAQVTIVPDS